MAPVRSPRNKNLKLTITNEDSQINKFSTQTLTHQSLQFPIQLRIMTDDEIREYHLKKFAQWGNKWKKEQSLCGSESYGSMARKILEGWRCLQIKDHEPCDCKTYDDCLKIPFIQNWWKMELK
jgi:hypothetical protein